MNVTLQEPGQPLKVLAVIVGTRPSSRGARLVAGAGPADELLGGHLDDALRALKASGAQDEVLKIPTVGHSDVPMVVATGLGATGLDADGDLTPEAVRRAVGAAVRALAGTARVAVALGDGSDPAVVGAITEGALLGGYRFDEYRTTPQTKPVGTVRIIAARAEANRAALTRATVIAEVACAARDYVNSPANDLYPASFAERATELAGAAGLAVEVLDEAALTEGGYGGILAVGSGSSRPPRLVRLSYRPDRPKARVALVGKGITYDSGGINIKLPAPVDMKGDMAGAAAVIAATVGAARLGLPVEVVATVPMAENLPSGTSYRPSDVLRMRGGKTVEVVNTDAEGRLVLADAIVRASEDEPDYLIETSTLTGAQVVALGERTAGVMGSDDLLNRISQAGARVGEPMWPMPLPEEMADQLKSDVADLKHVGSGRAGGMLVAGQFLSEFVPEGLSWAHIDVAGPAGLNSHPFGYLPKGATAVPARTIIAVLESISES
ncbi:MAG: leucyl aminopeptidase [Jatrophihabitans sp.]